jgi:hypothetical protein
MSLTGLVLDGAGFVSREEADAGRTPVGRWLGGGQKKSSTHLDRRAGMLYCFYQGH